MTRQMNTELTTSDATIRQRTGRGWNEWFDLLDEWGAAELSHRIRQRLGDEEFWSLATRWLQSHRFASQDRATLTAWWSAQSGQDLTPIFDAWLVAEREPAWHAG